MGFELKPVYHTLLETSIPMHQNTNTNSIPEERGRLSKNNDLVVELRVALHTVIESAGLF